ncbi:hypothetical protein [Streptomyces antibioticus]|uniref:hypothetical protein n=1 Tax=Streptomyces antibioticus TaxID=1890 RepID=UPI0033F0CBB7
MSHTGFAVLFSVASAVAYSAGALFQARVPHRESPAAGLFSHAFGRISLLLNGLGALLHVVALQWGPLILVQPFGALSIALSVPVEARLARRRTTPGERHGVALVLLGLAILSLTVGSSRTEDELLGTGEAVSVVTGSAVVVAVLTRAGKGKGRGLGYATAAGVAFAVASLFAQAIGIRLGDQGWSGLGRPDCLFALLAIGPVVMTGLLLSQYSYRYGLSGPLAASTVANPAFSVVVGLLFLGERFRHGYSGIMLAGAAAFLMVKGILMVTQSARARDRSRQGGARRGGHTALEGVAG